MRLATDKVHLYCPDNYRDFFSIDTELYLYIVHYILKEKLELQKINTERKKGSENFRFENENLNLRISDFWIWNQSNLIENRTRGILAEFIVKQALNIKDGIRTEWDSYDLKTETGIKIEIKSAAYIQSWEQKKHSNIKFGIAQTIGESGNSEYDGKLKRWSDFYVFCLLNNKNQNTGYQITHGKSAVHP